MIIFILNTEDLNIIIFRKLAELQDLLNRERDNDHLYSKQLKECIARLENYRLVMGSISSKNTALIELKFSGNKLHADGFRLTISGFNQLFAGLLKK